MYREESLSEISDGRLYGPNDMVKIGTGGCAGCSDCCRMDPLIVLDPCDACSMSHGLDTPFEELLGSTVDLTVVDGLIFPVLKMARSPATVGGGQAVRSDSTAAQGGQAAGAGSVTLGGSAAAHNANTANGAAAGAGSVAQGSESAPSEGVCPYLSADGRCEIHAFRPGICRMYPLGRSWENGDFSYILQTGECSRCNGTKVKVKKWLGIPDLPAYEDFCRKWHRFLTDVRHLLGIAPDGSMMESSAGSGNPASSKLTQSVCVYILKQFYFASWDDEPEGFYAFFDRRLAEARRKLGIL